MAWLPPVSTTVEPARADISRWAGGGIIRSSVATRYQLGLLRQAGSLTVPPSASTPHGTCESAMNAACSALTSPRTTHGTSRGRGRETHPAAGESVARARRAVDLR